MIKRTGLFLALTMLVVGSLGFAQTAIPETPGANVGGTLTIASGQTFKDLDPRISNSVYDFYIIDEVFDALMYLNPETMVPSPFIAKSWDVLSDTVIRFYLNEGIKFHNGEPLTAEDVAFSFNWVADAENASPNQSELIWLEEAVVIDDYTVDIITKADYAPYAPGMISMARAIVPKDTVLEMGDAAFNLNPIGSGPYKFVEWRAGDRIILERNEDYWLVYPNLDKVIYRPIPELSVMMLELEAGGVDIVDNMPAADVMRFKAMEEINVMQVASLSYFYIYFNMSRPPSNDIRWRKAFYMSANIDAAVFSIFQGLTGFRAYGVIPPRLWAGDVDYLRDNIALQEDDEEAKRLIAEMKAEGVIPEGYVTTIYTPLDPRRRQLATILATNLIENGIDAVVQPLDWGPYLELIDRSDADPLGEGLDQGIIGWSGGPDPHNFIYFMFHSDNAVIGSANNNSFYMNPVVDDLLTRAATTLDQAEREALYIEAQRIALGEYVHIPGYHYIETKGLRDRVQGFILNASGDLHLCNPYSNVWVDGS